MTRFTQNHELTVVTGYTDNISECARLATATKTAFCTLNHYNCIVNKDDSFDKSRLPAWSKLIFIQNAMKSEKFAANWIFWSDADALFLNFNTNLLDFIDETKEIVITKDFNNYNTGNFFIKNSDWSYNLLERAWGMVEYLQHPWFEQIALIKLFEDPDICRHIKVVDQRLFNSYPADPSKKRAGEYILGDFVLHFPGQDKKTLRAKFIPYLKDAGIYEIAIQEEGYV